MPNKEFLETFPLYRNYDKEAAFLVTDRASALSGVMSGSGIRPIRYTIARPAINFICPTCKSLQTYNARNEQVWFFTDDLPRIFEMVYVCGACSSDQRYFYIMLSQIEETIKKDGKQEKVTSIKIQKVGQYPSWSIDINKDLSDTLGEHQDFYKKGLTCESQSYGIGAYAYFRRITEEIIDQLLDSISSLIEDEANKEAYKVALEKTKQTRVTQEKIDLVKDLIPVSLKPGNMNPLGVLHSALSEGLHNGTDAECMEQAEIIRKSLIFLVNRIIRAGNENKEFTDVMKKLLKDKK